MCNCWNRVSLSSKRQPLDQVGPSMPHSNGDERLERGGDSKGDGQRDRKQYADCGRRREHDHRKGGFQKLPCLAGNLSLCGFYVPVVHRRAIANSVTPAYYASPYA